MSDPLSVMRSDASVTVDAATTSICRALTRNMVTLLLLSPASNGRRLAESVCYGKPLPGRASCTWSRA